MQPAGLLRQVRLQGCCTTTAALCLQAQLGDSIYAALERVAESSRGSGGSVLTLQSLEGDCFQEAAVTGWWAPEAGQ